ncbi:MAG: glutamate racemase [Candidatus Marinimicrobia bacterium]|nr:glutamate racemase [Candidatus Neomarinimicrobiota bacterium]|tara:strand:- start:9440 stop:10234 length:795 start_codon:yes stop_codon:yes gene_type:complete
MDNRAIGVFDSGIGGLTVVNALTTVLPNEKFIYVGDTARVPYGNKSIDSIRQYSLEITKWLLKKNCKMIVVACNTVSSLVLDYLTSSISIPIIGVIDPGVEQAISISKNNKIAVLGTHATIRSNAYGKRLKKVNPEIEVISQACPLFVPLVEEGWVEGKIPRQIAKHYFNNLVKLDVDTIILGCTHYPLLKSTIHTVLKNKAMLVDSGEATAKTVLLTLKKLNALSNLTDYEIDCYVTDDPDLFNEVALQFVLKKINKTSHIDL